MSTRIEDILEGARDLLADELPSARWDDPKLIRFLNEGYKEAVITNKLLKGDIEFFIDDDVRFLLLPDKVFLPTRVLYNGTKISFLTHQDLDRQHEEHHPSRFWECDEGPDPLALIFDLQDRRNATIFPILRDITKTPYTFNPNTLGVLLTIGTVSTGNPFGVIANVDDSAKEDGFIIPAFGVAANADDRGVIKVFFDRKPGELTDINSVIEIDSVFDIALKYYTIHMAFAADQDTMDNRMSEKYLSMYAAKITKAKKDAAMGYTIGDHHTDYQGFV